MPLKLSNEERIHGPKYVDKVIDEAVRRLKPPGPDGWWSRAVKKAFRIFIRGLEATEDD